MKLKSFFGFTAPSNFVMLALLVFPLVFSFWMGLHFITFRTINEPVFVGFENFRAILSDPAFWDSMVWTLLIIIITVPAHLILGLSFALILDQIKGRIRAFYLAALIIPMIVVPVIGTVSFKQLFDPPHGVLAWLFKEFSGEIFTFNETTMKFVILVHTIWIITPWALVLFFAGLQTLPKEQIDASSMDGATRWQQIRHVVIPHLRSLIILEALIGVMDMFRLFDNVFVLTRMNPIYMADTLMTYNYRVALVVKRLGKGNATAILLVIAIMVALIPFLYFMYHEQIEER